MPKSREATLSPSKIRILNAALQLFNQHGVAGTSLQMIADDIGVTKAAVYHQFNTKTEIVVAAAAMILAPLEAAAEHALAQPTPKKRRQTIVEELISQAVKSRHLASFLQRDPAILRLFDEHNRFRKMMENLNRLLLGDSPDEQARITTALILTAIGGTVSHPLVVDIDDDALRKQLHQVMRGLLKQL